MPESNVRRAIVIATIAILGSGLAGCSTSSSSDASKDKPAQSEPAGPVAPKPADLTGEWEQSNKKDPDSYQAATITADSIEVNWVSDGGDTTSLYWAGTFTPPTKAGSYSFDSANDTTKTESAMLASGDPTKTFSYDGSKISYKVSAMGTTTTVELAKK